MSSIGQKLGKAIGQTTGCPNVRTIPSKLPGLARLPACASQGIKAWVVTTRINAIGIGVWGPCGMTTHGLHNWDN